jgi:hypothetical protein
MKIKLALFMITFLTHMKVHGNGGPGPEKFLIKKETHQWRSILPKDSIRSKNSIQRQEETRKKFSKNPRNQTMKESFEKMGGPKNSRNDKNIEKNMREKP